MDSAVLPQERFEAVAGNNGYLLAVSVTSGQPKGPEPIPPEPWAWMWVFARRQKMCSELSVPLQSLCVLRPASFH